jgi:pyruvate dehydrogenase E2 component (dihydrolipoamide acetyltransferase)
VAATTEVLVPDIGDFEQVPVIEVLVSAGDRVNAEDPLVTLESDKATMDVPSPQTGIVKELKVSVGDTVSQGSPILTLEGDGDASVSDGEDAVEASVGAPAGAPTSESRIEAVNVPDIGDFEDVPVIDLLVKAGDAVREEDALITLESDKATMDVPSPHAGVVEALEVSVGDKVSQGSLILTMKVDGQAPEAVQKATQTPAAEVAAAPPPTTPKPAAPAPAGDERVRPSPTATISADAALPKAIHHATPAVRRFARELGVELGAVLGTGRKRRILKEDVKRFVKEALSRPAGSAAAGAGIEPVAAVDFSKFGEVETRALPRIKKISGPHLHRAWLNVPHVTHHDEADVTELEAFRGSLKDEAAKKGVRITALAFITKAVASTLGEFPSVNASLTPDGESLVYKKYFHVGIAMDTPNGLVVPVLRDVDQKGIYDLASEMAEISARARDGKLKPAEMQGGCFSISSLGGIGGTAFTPIVNAPEVAILGVTRARMSPIWNGKEFMPRLMLPLDLSYDHRVIDGAEAARFVAYLCGLLGDLRRLLL